MKGTVKIGNKNVDMVANALTPVLYKKIFRKDFLVESQKKDMDLTIFQELAFVMASQAQIVSAKQLMTELNVESYYSWLEEFEAMEIMEAVNDIFALYHSQTKVSSTSKKNP